MADPVYVYVIAALSAEGTTCKVGISKHPSRRLKQLKRPEVVRLVLSDAVAETAEMAIAIERYAHWLLRDFHIRGEWFAVEDPAAWRAVDEARAAVARGEVAEFRIAGAGRPHLKPTVRTVATMVRVRPSAREQIKELVGERNMAAFIREAIEEKLAASEPPSRKPTPTLSPTDTKGEGE